MTRNIKLVLEYDGTSFYGFQRQPRHRTVQEELEKALSLLFSGEVKIAAASGRTDSGVHASHQVVNFKTEKKYSLLEVQRGLNRYLPKAISVTFAEEVSSDFHARFSAKAKRYEYLIWNSESRSPLRSRTSCHIRNSLNVSAMRKASKFLVGKHNFESFCAQDPAKKNIKDRDYVRRVSEIVIKKSGALISIQIEADGFLYHMVRNIAGTLIEVGSAKKAPGEVEEILKARDRRQAGRTAPACGLSLIDVTYCK